MIIVIIGLVFAENGHSGVDDYALDDGIFRRPKKYSVEGSSHGIKDRTQSESKQGISAWQTKRPSNRKKLKRNRGRIKTRSASNSLPLALGSSNRVHEEPCANFRKDRRRSLMTFNETT